MYTKEQLEKLPIPELMAIASELGVKVSQNDEFENVVYAILDKAAEQVAAGEPVSKRKRTRIAKDNSKVYTVNGSESTTLDKKATKAGKKPTLDALIAEQAAAEKAETEQTEQAEEKPAPKKRVRKTKKEQEEETAAEAPAEAKPEKKTRKKASPKNEADLFAEEPVVEAIPEAVIEAIPEAEAVVEDDNEELSPEMIDQLQEKMASNIEAEEAPMEGDADDVWEGCSTDCSCRSHTDKSLCNLSICIRWTCITNICKFYSDYFLFNRIPSVSAYDSLTCTFSAIVCIWIL